MPDIGSSNIAAADYDAETRILTITFRSGERYEYRDVDRIVYDDLIHSTSPGGYFHRHIRNRFTTRRVL